MSDANCLGSYFSSGASEDSTMLMELEVADSTCCFFIYECKPTDI